MVNADSLRGQNKLRSIVARRISRERSIWRERNTDTKYEMAMAHGQKGEDVENTKSGKEEGKLRWKKKWKELKKVEREGEKVDIGV